MRARLLRYWERLRYSFWFVPTLMAAAAIVMSLLAVRVDQNASDGWVSKAGWIYATGPDGAREVLSAIAGSMITVAGVVFSITIVALSLASQQLGPRLLRTFMRDTGNQVVLGTFIATFLYCLLVLRTISRQEDQAFVPHFSVACGVALAMASLGVLIYFIHHVAISIQAPNVIAAVGHDLLHAIEGTYPKTLGRQPPEERLSSVGEELPEGFEEEARAVTAEASGYLQAVDAETLLRVGREHDLVFRMSVRPGDFVIGGQPFLRGWPGNRVTKKVEDDVRFAFIVGRRRTPTQDVEFAIEQLVEVAVRALSPSVNDPFTAMSCVDWLSAGLYRLAESETPAAHRLDEEGRLRIVADISTFAGLADVAFNQLRQESQGNVAVTCRLLEAIWRVAPACQDEERRRVLLHHATLIYRGSRVVTEPDDTRDIAMRYQAVLERLGPGENGDEEAERPRESATSGDGAA